jgi:hypothetical protein
MISYVPTLFKTDPILSSSAGQMSGQLVKPKYTNDHFPRRSFSVKGSPVDDVNEKGPPTCGRPYCLLFRSFSGISISQRSVIESRGRLLTAFLEQFLFLVSEVEE